MTELIQVKLLPMEEADRNQFILDNQEAFRYGALEEPRSRRLGEIRNKRRLWR